MSIAPPLFHKVDSSGGPYGTDITYSINDCNIASVDESGLITAKVISDAMVTGESRGLESVTGDIVTFSEVSFVILHTVCFILYYIVFILQGVVYVHVIKLTGVRISVPSTKLLAETEVSKTFQYYKCVLSHSIERTSLLYQLFEEQISKCLNIQEAFLERNLNYLLITFLITHLLYLPLLTSA